MKYEVIKWGKRGGEDVRIIKEWVPNEEGLIAMDLAHHFAIIAAKTEGEDKAGRAKIELQSADEVVQRSCDIAEKLVAEMKKRGWVLQLPIPEMPQITDEDIDRGDIRPAKDEPKE